MLPSATSLYLYLYVIIFLFFIIIGLVAEYGGGSENGGGIDRGGIDGGGFDGGGINDGIEKDKYKYNDYIKIYYDDKSNNNIEKKKLERIETRIEDINIINNIKHKTKKPKKLNMSSTESSISSTESSTKESKSSASSTESSTKESSTSTTESSETSDSFEPSLLPSYSSVIWDNFKIENSIHFPYPSDYIKNEKVNSNGRYSSDGRRCIPWDKKVDIIYRNITNFSDSNRESLAHKFVPPFKKKVSIFVPYFPTYWYLDGWKDDGTCTNPTHPLQCSLKCEDIECHATTNVDKIPEVDGIVYTTPKHYEHIRKIHQVRIGMMSDAIHKLEGDMHAAKTSYELIAHWHRSAHIWLTAHNNQFLPGGEMDPKGLLNFHELACPPVPFEQKRKALATFMIGNCGTPGGFRENYVKSLMEFIHIDCYGNCLKNIHHILPENSEIRSQHKFCITIENEVGSIDWVTERVFNALLDGCVPIYWGALNIAEYLPCKNCIIDISKFSKPLELAKYLIWLDKNPHEYNKYLEWKLKPLNIPITLLGSKRHSYCAMCKAVLDYKQGKTKKLGFDFNLKEWVPV